MKTIQPITIWFAGNFYNATLLSLICIKDNLLNSATFYYQLQTDTFLSIADGNLTMILPDYETDWQTNNAAYLWAATQLGLTITGEYIPA